MNLNVRVRQTERTLPRDQCASGMNTRNFESGLDQVVSPSAQVALRLFCSFMSHAWLPLSRIAPLCESTPHTWIHEGPRASFHTSGDELATSGAGSGSPNGPIGSVLDLWDGRSPFVVCRRPSSVASPVLQWVLPDFCPAQSTSVDPGPRASRRVYTTSEACGAWDRRYPY
jgi:hypothetical protein